MYKKLNNTYTGIIGGIILPLIIMIIILSVRKGDSLFYDYLKTTIEYKIFPKVISICLIPNLLLFFIFIRTNMLKPARGVLVSMFIAAFFIILFKLI